MKTLDYELTESPLGPNWERMLVPTALVTMKSRKEFYIGNPFDDIVAAVAVGAPFVAHRVVGGKPEDVIVNPSDVSIIERVGQ